MDFYLFVCSFFLFNSDADSWAVPMQILHSILGAVYFSWGIYNLFDFGDKILYSGAVCFISFLTILFIIWRRKDMNPSVVFLGKDEPFTEQAEKLQWETVKAKKVN